MFSPFGNLGESWHPQFKLLLIIAPPAELRGAQGRIRDTANHLDDKSLALIGNASAQSREVGWRQGEDGQGYIPELEATGLFFPIGVAFSYDGEDRIYSSQGCKSGM